MSDSPGQTVVAERPDLKSLPREAMRQWVVDALGERPFRGDQLFRWIHGRGARAFEGMTDLSKGLRERLSGSARLGGLVLDDVRVGADGTRKLLCRTADDHRIETVVIPMADRITQCVSSQVGCRIGCDFCLTARMPVRRNLSPAEIVDQVMLAQEVLTDDERVSNLVYMGMGEPLDNYDAVVASIRILMDDLGQNFAGRRITVSTSGVVKRIADLQRDVPVHLAVSLNASHDPQRDRLIPINRKWPIASLIEAIAGLELPPRRRVTVEYVMLAGVNDTDEDARRLVRLLRPIQRKIKLNLIPFNPWPGSPYGRPEPARVEAFGGLIRDAHLHVTVRYSKGDDIGAACGQLDGEVAAA